MRTCTLDIAVPATLRLRFPKDLVSNNDDENDNDCVEFPIVNSKSRVEHDKWGRSYSHLPLLLLENIKLFALLQFYYK